MSRAVWKHRSEIRAHLRPDTHLLIGSDFDGTLAPIEQTPAAVELNPSNRELLQSLVHLRNVSVALISGRALDDLRSRIRVPGAIYAGNHGLEIKGPGYEFLEPTAASQRENLRALSRHLAMSLSHIDGAEVEEKGLTTSVHFRRVSTRDRKEVVRTVQGAFASGSQPFVLTTGKCVYEIRPRVDWDKGAAVRWISGRITAPRTRIIYIGDDLSDEQAFTALPEEITVRVGEASVTAARYYLEGPAEVPRFLSWILSLRTSGALLAGGRT
ncbi:MAG: trehalose-phosphatase [Acidobacteria bacterium]|nr:trehalose-phosphatase [Acidobacteriota bacterium]